MNIKETFILNKDTPNLLNLSKKEIKEYSVENGIKLTTDVLGLLDKSIDHFTKKPVFNLFKDKSSFEVLILPTYTLHVSYNVPTKQIIVNLNPFGVETISTTSPEPRNLYTCLAYGLLMKNFIEGKSKRIKLEYYNIIPSFLTSVFVQVFGRQYGLTGRYSGNIPMLKFLITLYILVSFFGVKQKEAYTLAARVSSTDYKTIEKELDEYNFTSINDLIKSLSELGVFPGITTFHFLDKVYKMFTVHFLPAFEDMSRFLACMLACSIPLETVIPRFISSKYNIDEYNKILEITKLLLR